MFHTGFVESPSVSSRYIPRYEHDRGGGLTSPRPSDLHGGEGNATTDRSSLFSYMGLQDLFDRSKIDLRLPSRSPSVYSHQAPSSFIRGTVATGISQPVGGAGELGSRSLSSSNYGEHASPYPPPSPSPSQVSFQPSLPPLTCWDRFNDSLSYLIETPWIIKSFRFFLFYLVGILVYEQLEGWGFLDAFYFITQTVTTVGYGDVYPSTIQAQWFTVFYMFLGLLLAYSLLVEIIRVCIHYFKFSLYSSSHKLKKLNKFQVFVRSFLNLLLWIAILCLIILFGAVVFKHTQTDWSWERAIYFAAFTASSLGYGNVIINTVASKWFDCFYMLIFVAMTAITLEKISSFPRHLNRAELWQILEEIELTPTLLDALDPNSAYNTGIVETNQMVKSGEENQRTMEGKFRASKYLAEEDGDDDGKPKRSLQSLEEGEPSQITAPTLLEQSISPKPMAPMQKRMIPEAEYILHMLQLEGKLDFENDLLRWKLRFREFDMNKDGFLSDEDVQLYQTALQEKEAVAAASMKDDDAKTSSNNILWRFYEETKEVFLETLGYHPKNAIVYDHEDPALSRHSRAVSLKKASSRSNSLNQTANNSTRPKSTQGVELRESLILREEAEKQQLEEDFIYSTLHATNESANNNHNYPRPSDSNRNSRTSLRKSNRLSEQTSNEKPADDKV